jgi:hypothetical protein
MLLLMNFMLLVMLVLLEIFLQDVLLDTSYPLMLSLLLLPYILVIRTMISLWIYLTYLLLRKNLFVVLKVRVLWSTAACGGVNVNHRPVGNPNRKV